MQIWHLPSAGKLEAAETKSQKEMSELQKGNPQRIQQNFLKWTEEGLNWHCRTRWQKWIIFSYWNEILLAILSNSLWNKMDIKFRAIWGKFPCSWQLVFISFGTVTRTREIQVGLKSHFREHFQFFRKYKPWSECNVML